MVLQSSYHFFKRVNVFLFISSISQASTVGKLSFRYNFTIVINFQNGNLDYSSMLCHNILCSKLHFIFLQVPSITSFHVLFLSNTNFAKFFFGFLGFILFTILLYVIQTFDICPGYGHADPPPQKWWKL